MVHIVRYLSAAALISVSSAAPLNRRDGSAIGSEIPVSAPFGIPMSDVPSSTDTSVAAATAAAPPPPPASMAASSVDTASIATASIASMATMDSMAAMASSMAMASMPPPPPMASSMDMASMPPPPMANSMTDSASAVMMATDTMSAAMPQMTYGSGSSSMGSGYDSCVQQCAANNPMASMAPSATQSSGSSGSGVTHTVIVAPTQGVLRYIPFSTNASVGDTVSFVWGAGPHTVTQSSALEVCNKTSAPGAFASGSRNKTFVFNQVVNNTNPIWFYCGIPNHCQKGMFGGVNIGQPDPTSTSTTFVPLSSVMANLTMTNPNMSAMLTMTQSMTAGNPYASSWGMNTNCAGMNMEAMMQTAQNVMFMQTLIATNPQTVKDGRFAVTSTSNLTIPANLLSVSNSTMSMPSSASPSPAASAMPGAASASPATKSNGAGSIASSTVAVGLVAILATIFAL